MIDRSEMIYKAYNMAMWRENQKTKKLKSVGLNIGKINLIVKFKAKNFYFLFNSQSLPKNQEKPNIKYLKKKRVQIYSITKIHFHQLTPVKQLIVITARLPVNILPI